LRGLCGLWQGKLKALDIEALKLSKTMQAENQPMKRLMDAITTSQKLEQEDFI
jgi:hypothetical protein